MKVKFIASVLVMIFLCNVASAQSYSIRITFNTNLRTAASLQARIVETAPAGTTLSVVGSVGRWLQVDRNGNQMWMAGWVGHTRVQISQQTTSPPQNQPQSQIDNCCFVDRQCNSDQEWTDGYWAFQTGRCAAPAQTQPQTSEQPVSAGPGQIDNCCFAGWQCTTDEQWANGYHAFLNNACNSPQQSTAGVHIDLSTVDNCCRVNRQCNTDSDWDRGWAAYKYYRCDAHIPITVAGPADFAAEVIAAFQILKDRSPQWYKYSIDVLDKVKLVPGERNLAIVYWRRRTIEMTSVYAFSGRLGLAAGMAHEACHVYQRLAGRALSRVERELECEQVELQAALAIDPSGGLPARIQFNIDNIHNPEHQWWRGVPELMD